MTCPPHHWLLGMVKDGISHGVCSGCGEERDWNDPSLQTIKNWQASVIRGKALKNAKR